MAKSIVKNGPEELDLLVRRYRRSKDDKVISQILAHLEPVIRGRVNAIIVRSERYTNKHVSDFEDLCQESRLKIVKIIGRWKSSRGKFRTYANWCIKNHLNNLMTRLHGRNICKVIDHQISIDAKLFGDDVSQCSLLEVIPNNEISQEEMMAIERLREVVEKAIEEAISGTEFGYEVFKLLMMGKRPSDISRILKRKESLVRLLIRRVVKRMRYLISSHYQEFYFTLSDEALKLVKIRVPEPWY